MILPGSEALKLPRVLAKDPHHQPKKSQKSGLLHITILFTVVTNLEVNIDKFMRKCAELVTEAGHVFSSLLCCPRETVVLFLDLLI